MQDPVLALGSMLTEWCSLQVLTVAVASCARALFVRDGTALDSRFALLMNFGVSDITYQQLQKCSPISQPDR